VVFHLAVGSLAKRDLVGSLYALRRRGGRGCYAPTPLYVVLPSVSCAYFFSSIETLPKRFLPSESV
jgi:hypothetical protein